MTRFWCAEANQVFPPEVLLNEYYEFGIVLDVVTIGLDDLFASSISSDLEGISIHARSADIDRTFGCVPVVLVVHRRQDVHPL